MTNTAITKNPGISAGVLLFFEATKPLNYEASLSFIFAVVLLAVELRLRREHVLRRLCR